MLQFVLAQVHYQPDSWKDHAHTDYVQAEFGQMFQLKYVCLLMIFFNDEKDPHDKLIFGFISRRMYISSQASPFAIGTCDVH